MRTMSAFLLSLALLAAGPTLGAAQTNPPEYGLLEELLVDMADTPREHAALARYYRGKAEQMRTVADEHRSMSKAYGGLKMTQRQRMQSHCSDLATSFDRAAEEYEALAKEHEDAA